MAWLQHYILICWSFHCHRGRSASFSPRWTFIRPSGEQNSLDERSNRRAWGSCRHTFHIYCLRGLAKLLGLHCVLLYCLLHRWDVVRTITRPNQQYVPIRILRLRSCSFQHVWVHSRSTGNFNPKLHVTEVGWSEWSSRPNSWITDRRGQNRWHNSWVDCYRILLHMWASFHHLRNLVW